MTRLFIDSDILDIETVIHHPWKSRTFTVPENAPTRSTVSRGFLIARGERHAQSTQALRRMRTASGRTHQVQHLRHALTILPRSRRQSRTQT